MKTMEFKDEKKPDSSDENQGIQEPCNKKLKDKSLNHKEFGDLGERIAATYLIQKGFEILSAKYRTKIGEIDLIARKGKLLVFVEVKTRKTKVYGRGFESVNYKKQQTLRRVATQYLAYGSGSKNSHESIRFDVIDIFLGRQIPEINHIENAF